MTRCSHFVAATLAAVAVATNSVAAALPGYLGAFGTARDALVNPKMVFLYTFDQHECSTNPTFENKITTDFGTHTVSDLTLVAGSTVNPTCLTGSAGSGFANTPVEPGFNQTNSGALVSSDFLTTETFDTGIVSGFSTLELWITIDVLTLEAATFTSIVYLTQDAIEIGVFDAGGGEFHTGFRSSSQVEAQVQDRDGLMHVVFVHDHVNTQNKIYVNGTSFSLYAFGTTRNTKIPEATSVKVPFFDTEVITMHSVALYDRELTITEIDELFTAGIPPSLPVFPDTLVIEGTEGIDVDITANTLLSQTSDPSGTLSGVEIISKRAADLFPANTPSLPAVGASFTVTAEPGRSTYDPTAPANEVCGTTTDSEYIIYQISTVPTGCEDSTGNNLCSMNTNLKICLSFVDSPATWESGNVDVTDAAFDMWTPLTGLVPNDDDGEDLTLLVSGNPTFDIGYTEDANDCTGNIVTIAKNSAPATTLTALALGKPICYKSSNVFEAAVSNSGTISLKEINPDTIVVADFTVSVDFPYSLTSESLTTLQEDGSVALTFVASDSRSTLTSGYKFKITALPSSASSEYFFSTSSDKSNNAAKVSAGDTLDATRQGTNPEFDLYFHAIPNYFNDNPLSVFAVVSNGDEVIPDNKAFGRLFTVEEVPDLVVFSNAITTNTVYPHVFTPIAGLMVTDVDPIQRNLSLNIVVDSNTAVKYSGSELVASTGDCTASTALSCVACLFTEAGCIDIDFSFVATSDFCNDLFTNLEMSNLAQGLTNLQVRLDDELVGGATYAETFTIAISGVAAPTMLPTTMYPTKTPTSLPTTSPSNSPTVAPTNVPTFSPTLAPTNMPTFTPTLAPTAPTSTPSESPSSSPTVSPTTDPALDGTDEGRILGFEPYVFAAITVLPLLMLLAILLIVLRRLRSPPVESNKEAIKSRSFTGEPDVDYYKA